MPSASKWGGTMARKVVWGIDIGQTALRAVKAMPAGDRIDVLGFDAVEYEEMLSAPDVDRDGAIQQALRTFLARNRLTAGDIVLTCIPGQSALIRFIKLPPVEKKRVPDIVRYEAHQQIPFPLEEVVWDYKPLEQVVPGGQQVEVGIFAMRRDIVHGFLSNLMVCSLDVDALQLAPMALHNYVAYDQPGGQEAQLVIDMGAENTELLIRTADSVWPRSLPISGNDFTEAIMEKFKVPFGKAEALKRVAKQSKYSKQIYHAIETPLRRMVEEVQRSIGYYKSINPGIRIVGILALGGSFKLPGLGKYLSERLHMSIRSLTEPQNFNLGSARNPRVFNEHALSFGVALGLAVQGCGMGSMDISLLPQELLQRKIIARKKPWAAAVAVCALLMFGTAWYSTWQRGAELEEATSEEAQRVKNEADKSVREYEKNSDVTDEKKKLDRLLGQWQGRDLWLRTYDKIFGPLETLENRRQGPWLRKVVTARIDFDTVAHALAEGVTSELSSPLGFDAKDMELESGFISRLRARIRTSGYGAVDIGPGRGPGGRTRAGQKKKVVERPDVIYVVVQGQTTHRQKGSFVTSVFVDSLTNTWVAEKFNKKVRSVLPPDDITVKIDNKDTKISKGEFKLADRPLIADVRYLGDVTEKRFVDLRGRVVTLESLGGDWSREYQAIVEREKLIEGEVIKKWRDGDKEDEAPLRTRDQFLADLVKEKGVSEEQFTDFEFAFFLDPSGDLFKEVAQLKKDAAERLRRGPGRGLGMVGRP